MKTTFIWQQSDWPQLRWDDSCLIEAVGRVRKLQGQVLGQFEPYDLKPVAEFVVQDAVHTSAIEGQAYDPDLVRSSVARRLGLSVANLPPQQRQVEGLVEMLLDATTNYGDSLTADRLFGWHAGLFPSGYSGIRKIIVADWRRTKDPMQVISGPMGREKVHYEAPPSKLVTKEMKQFFKWWHHPPKGLDGLIRAGVAHFWFITIHPFDDGNGRIARAITDLALAQDEKSGLRLYSLSTQISKKRKDYYKFLEAGQRGSSDITQWLLWFLETLNGALKDASKTLAQVRTVSEVWKRLESLNRRQAKVIQRMLESEPDGFEGGITNKKYVAIAKTSPETAKRDLADLVKRGFLIRNRGQGRSTSYSLKK